jgi:GAF domain-containing protein
VISEYLQQWTAIQAMHAGKFSTLEVWVEYLGLSGHHDEVDVTAYLSGMLMLPVLERDLMAQAINGMIEEQGTLIEGAHYSADFVTEGSGFADYLRVLVLDPEGYRFDRPAQTEPDGVTGGLTTGTVGTGHEDRVAEAEVRRCNALTGTGLSDTGAEPRFDRFTALARERFDVSSSSIALITADRQVIKSVVGPIGQDLPREVALCSRTIEADRTLIITDATTDPDYQDHPLVTGGPHIRFYAGHPLSTADGWRIGTLCIIDDQPRSFTAQDARDLRILAGQVQLEILLGSTDDTTD